MRHRSLLALAIFSVGVLAACSDASPPAPTAALAPVARRTAPACDASGVRSSLAQLLLTGDAKSEAIPGFNRAEQQQRKGYETAARREYFGVIDVVLREFSANRLREPKGRPAPSKARAVEELLLDIFACADEVPPPGLGDALETTSGPDQAVCLSASGLPLDCTLPNRDVTVVAEAGFFIAPAVMTIKPGNSDPFGNFAGRWSPVWKITVLPLSSQANYPQYPASGPPAALTPYRAAVAACVVDRSGVEHPSRSLLRVAQAAETGPVFLLPAALLFDGTDLNAALDCTEGSTDVAVLRSSPFGSSRLALAGWGAVRDAGRALGDALSPRPLYAFDGGLGGVTHSFESQFAIVEPGISLYAFAQQQVPPSTGAPIVATGATLQIPDGSTFDLFVSTSASSLVPAAGCTWSYHAPSLPTGSHSATLTGSSVYADFQGDTHVRATCDDGVVDLQITVTPPPVSG